ncbi:MAG: hypothetical protein ACXVSE_02535 [Solirubrobacteraceae bacterium]
MTPRLRLLAFLGLALLAILALLVAGTRHIVVRTASADTPNQTPLPPLNPGQTACEGPLVSHGPARSVGVWGTSGPVRAHLTVTVQDAATHAVLASGALGATPGNVERVAHLVREAPGGRPLRVCVTDDAGQFSLAGSTASAPGLVATGLPAGLRFSLALLDDGGGSLIGSLSTAFSRASLWRPSWVGPWTFWVLAVALLATFGLAVFAVVTAAADDNPSSAHFGSDGPAPTEPSTDDRSEAGQDRPQPVS